MKRHVLPALSALLVGLALPVCAQNLATVNGKPVPKARVVALKQQFENAGRPIGAELEGRLKEEVIAREVYTQEAQKLGLEGSDDFKVQMQLARQAVLMRELFTQYEKRHPVTDAEIKAEYDRVAAVKSGQEYHARHILVEKEDEAKAIIAALKKGARFEEIAQKQSKDPGSGARGGDLDWSGADRYVPEFSQALQKLKKGETTAAPVKTQFGWHVIRLDDVRDAQLPQLEAVKPQIVQSLQQQKLAKYQEDLRTKAKIQR